MAISSATPAALGALLHALEQRQRDRSARRSRDPRRGRSPDSPRPAWTSRRRPGAARPAPGRRPRSHQLELEPHPGQRRAQVVADRRQHLGALADVAQDALAHQVEGVGRLADLHGTARPEVADVATLAEAVGGAGELADRADLQAQEVDRDRRRAPPSCRPSRSAGARSWCWSPACGPPSPSAGRGRSARRRRCDPGRRCSRSTANGWFRRSAKASRILLSIWPTSLSDAGCGHRGLEPGRSAAA